MKLHLGDVVVLKSGGPTMTVEGWTNGTENVVKCEWFNDMGDVCRDNFWNETLILQGEKK